MDSKLKHWGEAATHLLACFSGNSGHQQDSKGRNQLEPKEGCQLSTLECLPTDIIRRIVRLLPLSSAAALTFTSKTMLRILGRKCWVELNRKATHIFESDEKKLEFARFLFYLEKDLTHSYACLQCWRIHDVDSVPSLRERLNRIFTKKKNVRCQTEYMDKLGHGYLFNGSHISFIMLHRMIRQHKTGILKHFALWRLEFSEHTELCGIPLKRSMEFSIVSGDLFMRGKYTLTMDIGRLIYGSLQSTESSVSKKLYICPHVCPWNEPGRQLYDVLVLLRMQAWKLKPPKGTNSHEEQSQHLARILKAVNREPPCSLLYTCGRCCAEYKIKVERKNNSKIQIVITRWLNLGGLETPYSPRYRAMMTTQSVRSNYGLEYPQPYIVPGSIRAVWEKDRHDSDILDAPFCHPPCTPDPAHRNSIIGRQAFEVGSTILRMPDSA